MPIDYQHVAISFSAGLLTSYIIYTLSQPSSKILPNLGTPSNLTSSHLPPASVGIESTIGNTPLILIKSLSTATNTLIFAKCEFLNGAGSSPKDRVALSIISRAESHGLLPPNSTIYEGTVGSTGISLATLARARGLRAHICMPDDQSFEKSELLGKLGATVERVRMAPIVDPEHYVNRARRLAEEQTARSLARRSVKKVDASGEDEHDGTADESDEGLGLFANQFETDANWRAHYETTGPEIWEQINHDINAFVAGAGTGGTISGVAKFLKQQTNLQVVLADPTGSGLYNKIKHGVMFHGLEREGTRRRQQVDTVIEGIGLSRTTKNFEIGADLIDDAVKVTDDQARKMAKWLCEKDGIFVGSSSAVNCEDYPIVC